MMTEEQQWEWVKKLLSEPCKTCGGNSLENNCACPLHFMCSDCMMCKDRSECECVQRCNCNNGVI